MNNIAQLPTTSPAYMVQFRSNKNTFRRALGIKSIAETPKHVLDFIDTMSAFATPLYPQAPEETQRHIDECVGACVRRFLEDHSA